MKINKMIYQKDEKIELLYTEKYKNYQYYILNLGTHPTAYVEISKGHKLYNKNYNDIDIIVHGGLTYSGNELMGISSNNWYIGWDYGHCTDYYGYEECMPENLRTYCKKWTTEEIIEECKNAIDQIIDFEREEILEEEKKIPEKLEILNANEHSKEGYYENYSKVEISLDIETLQIWVNKIINYLKSKGE